jgi:predicted dehydrogenase
VQALRYGVIGTGLMGVEHIHNLNALEGARVVAIADPHEPSLERGAKMAEGPVAAFTDHRALLESGLCDAVVIATPNMTHAPILLDALATSHHVLVEKPLCTTLEDCRRVIEAARNHAGVVWMGLEYRYMPAVARLLAELRAGSIGPVRMVAIREHRFPFLPKVGDWNRFNRNTGGTLVEKCCHFFDLMNLITGSPAVRVLASGGQAQNHLDERYGGMVPDILDHAFVIVEYASGARAMLDLCMFAEASRNEQEIAVVGAAGKLEALIPEGVLRVGFRGRHRVGEVESIAVAPGPVGHRGFHHGSSFIEHARFLEAIRCGRPSEVTLEDGMRAVALGVAAHRSIDEGGPVAVTELLGPAER